MTWFNYSNFSATMTCLYNYYTWFIRLINLIIKKGLRTASSECDIAAPSFDCQSVEVRYSAKEDDLVFLSDIHFHFLHISRDFVVYLNHNIHTSFGFDGGYLVRDCLLGFVHHAE
jgi:tricorn protease-like protein